MKKRADISAAILAAAVVLTGLLGSCHSTKQMTSTLTDDKSTIGIAWRADTSGNSYLYHYRTIEAAGGRPTLLSEVKPPYLPYEGDEIADSCLDENGILLPLYADMVKRYGYEGSNVERVMRGIPAVLFTGGPDISPTLFREPQPWHGIESERNFNATRDVADYLLMRYCIDRDIPVLAVCRGHQVLGVVAGCSYIQDIPSHYAAAGRRVGNLHRNPPVAEGETREYAAHDVTVTDKASHLFDIMGTDTIGRVPSWHHQALGGVEGTELKVTGITTHDGIDIIEAVEMPGKRFIVGLQYHPEVAVCRHIDNDPSATLFQSHDDAIACFRRLVAIASGTRR